MLYEKKTVRCSAKGFTREAARRSLEDSGEFEAILDLSRKGDQWVATVLKQAEFPPAKDDGGDDDGPPKSDDGGDNPFKEDSDSDSGDDAPKEDGPPKPKGEGEKGGEKAELAALLDMITAIADKLGVVPGGMPMGAEDGPLPGDPMAPPPPGPPGAPEGHQEIVHKTKLKPGEAAPGTTPIGAPAFASVDPSNLSRMASFDAFDDTPGKTIKQAKEELEAMYGPHGFKVRQIKRVEGGQRLAAKLSRR